MSKGKKILKSKSQILDFSRRNVVKNLLIKALKTFREFKHTQTFILLKNE